jgi:plasmid stability protein
MVFHMKRTTLVLDERQFTELKKLAAAEGRTLSSVTEEILRAGLASKRRRANRNLSRLPSWNMGRPRVDVADRNALCEAMEGR